MADPIPVLVIDDSEDDRFLYRRALKRDGDPQYVITECEDGDEGLQHVDDEEPACVLLDYSLPGRNGVEILKRLRAKHAFIPVVMLTGQGNEEIAVMAMREGAQNYITKSQINAEEIHRTIQMAMAHCAMEKRIRQQRASLETFTRALAHDLKEPVRTISSFLGLLDAHHEFTAAREAGYFNHIQTATSRMSELIDAVHFYTKLSDPQDVEKSACDSNVLFAEAKADIAELIRERSAVVTADPLPLIEADGVQVRRVLQNLICNAIKHTPVNPSVHVGAFDAGAHWVMRVADNGPGIEPTQREKIFEPFVRLVKQKEGGGMGMGLAITRRIIEMHGGKVWCDPNPQGGSVFCFSLPKAVAKPDKGETMAAEPHAAPSLAMGEARPLASMLIVDDNEVDLELAKIILQEEEKLRCDLLVACGGDEALGVLHSEVRKSRKIDLVLLDINMPGMDGFQLLERIRKDPLLAGVPVVMCTTSSYDKDIAQAQSLGANGYMTKPARLEKLKSEFGKIPALQLVDDKPDGCSLLRVN